MTRTQGCGTGRAIAKAVLLHSILLPKATGHDRTYDGHLVRVVGILSWPNSNGGLDAGVLAVLVLEPTIKARLTLVVLKCSSQCRLVRGVLGSNNATIIGADVHDLAHSELACRLGGRERTRSGSSRPGEAMHNVEDVITSSTHADTQHGVCRPSHPCARSLAFRQTSNKTRPARGRLRRPASQRLGTEPCPVGACLLKVLATMTGRSSPKGRPR